MLKKLNSDNIKFAESFLEGTSPNFLYHYLSGEGYTYATLALGVAEQNTVAGIVALNYMKEVATAQGVPVDESKIQEVLRLMAGEYLKALKEQIGSDPVEVVRDINHREVWAFHNKVFTAAGYTAEAWTLNSVLSVMPEDGREAYWQRVLASAGDAQAELDLAVDTYVQMHFMAFDASNENRQMAARWIRRIESIKTASAIVELGTVKLKQSFGEYLDSFRVFILGKPPASPYHPAPNPGAPPPKVATPLPPIPVPTPPPARRRRRRGGGRRPPTTAGGYNNSGHYGGSGDRLKIDP